MAGHTILIVNCLLWLFCRLARPGILQLPNKTVDSCKWTPIVRNGKLKGGISAGTFHRLGYTPNMETCTDLCCNMDVCGVALRNKDDCFGIECNSDDLCDSVPADLNDIKIEIAHVRAGRKSANLTDISMAGQCKSSHVYKEVTLKGGINAGTYKDVGGVTTIEECQKKCCEFPACDLAFMLAGSCYLVGCYDQKQCGMQPAKESKFHPQISYVTRWNSEGVKHTVLLQEKGVQYTCPKMNALVKVTLKGGLQAGDFTDVGKVNNLQQCYDICCQQEKCDLAFMLGQNCFSVQCKDKRLCVTTPAQPSIFNPQIAYVPRRERGGTVKSGITHTPPPSGIAGACPKTKVFDKMTLKGGVDAGAYKDHGKVKDMDVCRRICCEMTECHLAFMLGNNCFSVKCANVDSCRAQNAKPSAYYPKISYIRKVGTNELLPNAVDYPLIANKTKPTANQIPSMIALAAAQQNAVRQNVPQVKEARPETLAKPLPSLPGLAAQVSLLGNGATGYAVTPNGLKPIFDNKVNETKDLSIATMNNEIKPAAVINSSFENTVEVGAVDVKSNIEKLPAVTAARNDTSPVNVDAPVSIKDQELMSALEPAEGVTSKMETPVNNEKCTPGILKTNVTLKGGRKSGEFIEIKGLKDMKTCVKRCCEDRDKKCNLAFMLGDTCYSVSCKNKDLCRTVTAPPTKFNPLVQYVRGLDEEPMPPTAAPTTMFSTASKQGDSEGSDISSTSDSNDDAIKTEKQQQPVKKLDKQTQKVKSKLKSCVSQPIVKEKSLKGGKKAGKFKIYKDINNMESCMSKCCSLKKQCDVAYMENSKCFSIQCFKKSACGAIEQRDNEVNPQFAYMDHFLEKVDEEETEKDITTELDTSEEGACANVEVIHNKTLKGGTRAGKFRPMGKKSMKGCVNNCCDRPDCDIAYLLNGHCYSVECTDGKLCQTTSEPTKIGDNIQLAYMNKAGIGEKQRDYMVVYIIVGSLGFAATLGALIWAIFAFSKKQRVKKRTYKRLLDDDDDDEPMEHASRKRPHHTRYRQPRH